MLAGISIKNFAVLQELTLGLDLAQLQNSNSLKEAKQLTTLSQFTVLIGQNSSGKTSFLESLEFLSNTLTRDVQIASNLCKQGSYNKLLNSQAKNNGLLEFDLVFIPSGQIIFPKQSDLTQRDTWLHYSIKINADKNYRPFIQYESVESYSFKAGVLIKEQLLENNQGEGFVAARSFEQNTNLEMSGQTELASNGKNPIQGNAREQIKLTERKISALSIFGKMLQYQELVWLYEQITNYYFAQLNELPDLRQEIVQTGGHKHLNRKATNIENVLYYLKKERSEQYQALVQRLNENLPPENKLDPEDPDIINGKGNLKLFIVYLILADQRPLIALDEPDAGLYYDMIDSLKVELRDYSVRNPDSQVFISTHNANMLDAFAPSEVWSFDRRFDRDNQPQISARYIGDDQVVKAMYREGVGLGSLWYSGYLDQDS